MKAEHKELLTMGMIFLTLVIVVVIAAMMNGYTVGVSGKPQAGSTAPAGTMHSTPVPSVNAPAMN